MKRLNCSTAPSPMASMFASTCFPIAAARLCSTLCFPSGSWPVCRARFAIHGRGHGYASRPRSGSVWPALATRRCRSRMPAATSTTSTTVDSFRTSRSGWASPTSTRCSTFSTRVTSRRAGCFTTTPTTRSSIGSCSTRRQSLRPTRGRSRAVTRIRLRTAPSRGFSTRRESGETSRSRLRCTR